jgi:hypothetical protein
MRYSLSAHLCARHLHHITSTVPPETQPMRMVVRLARTKSSIELIERSPYAREMRGHALRKLMPCSYPAQVTPNRLFILRASRARPRNGRCSGRHFIIFCAHGSRRPEGETEATAARRSKARAQPHLRRAASVHARRHREGLQREKPLLQGHSRNACGRRPHCLDRHIAKASRRKT